LSADTLVASATFNGEAQLLGIDLNTGTWRRLADEADVNDIKYDAITRINDSSIVGIFTGSM